MAQELLRYRPAEAGHDVWLARITELVNAAGAAPAPSRSLVPPPSQSARAGHVAHGAPPPPPPGGDAGRNRDERAPEGAPPPSHGASSPHLDGPSCQIIQRAPEDARVVLERQRERQTRVVQDIATAGRHTRVEGTPSYSGGCLAFTRELRRVVWPTKFRPELPPRYDGNANPIEFLQLYTVGIQAASGDSKVMANWFPMALKDAARTWLLNLPEESISSWSDLCEQFVANFKATYERPLTLNDLRAVRQRPGETLRAFTQRFSQVRNKIPRIAAAAILSAFTTGVTDVKMREKLSVYDELTSTVRLFELADKCSKAEEGRLFTHTDPDVAPAAPPVKSKGKDPKRRTEAVLAAEPERKQRRGDDDAGKDNRPFCAYHNKHTHNTADCYELKKLRDERGGQWKRGNGRGGGRGGGRSGGHGNNYPQNSRANAPQLRLAEAGNNLAEGDVGGYQEPRGYMACILGGAQAPLSNRHFKQLTREIAAVQPGVDAQKLRWSQFPISFDAGDHPKTTRTVGTIPLVCTPTINNVAVTRTLIDGGAGLSVISVETFEKTQVPYERLMPTRPFSGVTEGTTIPLGQVRLPVTFGTRENYRTELIDFDVAHIGLPYNAILGYPALAKFMAVTHHAYNTVKIPSCSGTITVRGDEKDAVRSIEHVYKAAAAAYPADEDAVEHIGGSARKKQMVSQENAAAKRASSTEDLAEPVAGSARKQRFSQERATTKKVSLDPSGSGATVTIGGSLSPK